MALSPLTIIQFQFIGITGVLTASAAPVVDGQVYIHLNKDCQAPSGTGTTPGQVGGKQKKIIQLDSGGEVSDTYLFWPNSELVPSDSAYIITVEDSSGERILGPLSVYVGNAPGLTGFGVSFGTSFGS